MKTTRLLISLLFLIFLYSYSFGKPVESSSVDSTALLKQEIALLHRNLDSVESMTLKLENSIDTLKATQKRLKTEKKEDRGNFLFSILILVFAGAMAFLLFNRANEARKDMLARADKEGDVTELIGSLMKQTFGLPQGTLRGIIALVVITAFISAVFYYGASEIPDAFKIIVSMIFGYYFSKKEDQTKMVMDAMLGKTKQQALKKQQASAALAEARAQRAEQFASDLYKQAADEFGLADNDQRPGDAIQHYEKAIELARQAASAAKENKRQADDKQNKEKRELYDVLLMEVNRRIGNLREIKTAQNTISILEELIKSANTDAQTNDFEKASVTLNRAKERIDVLLEDYDEAQKRYESLEEEKREKIENDLDDVLKSFDTSFVNDIPGDNTELIESLVRMQGQVKEQDSALVPLFRKRILGEVITVQDIVNIYKDVKNRGDQKLLKTILQSAATHIGIKLSDVIRDEIELPENIEKIILGSEDEKSTLFKDLFEKNGVADKGLFNNLVDRIKEELVDATIGDSMKKALPESINFQSITQLVSEAQKDKDGKGILGKLSKVLDVGETILNLTPIGNFVKTASVVVKGIFKIFGKKKRNKS